MTMLPRRENEAMPATPRNALAKAKVTANPAMSRMGQGTFASRYGAPRLHEDDPGDRSGGEQADDQDGRIDGSIDEGSQDQEGHRQSEDVVHDRPGRQDRAGLRRRPADVR